MDCLPKAVTSVLIKKLKDGTIDPYKLADMKSSKERRDFFQKELGVDKDKATEINGLLESKIMKPIQDRAMISWVNRMIQGGGKKKIDLMDKVKNIRELLTAETEQQFFEDYVAERLRLRVTLDQANQLAEMSKEIDVKKEALDGSYEKRMEYGLAVVNFDNYVKSVRHGKEITIHDVLGVPRALVASLDNSALGRQGLVALMTHPTIWARNAAKSFKDLAITLGGKPAIDYTMAEILSRENSINGLYTQSELAVGTTEEDYPTSLPERLADIKIKNRVVDSVLKPIKIAGSLFKASQDAYTGFLYRTRADLFDRLLVIADKSNVKIEDEYQLKSIGRLVNSMTGRGVFLKGETAKVANELFFSPKLLAGNIDVLSMSLGSSVMVNGKKKLISKFAHQQAAKNMLRIIIATASVLGLAAAMGLKVEKDPRSADFGTIRAGNTRFDMTGGKKTIAVLAFRLINAAIGNEAMKSSTTGIKRKINQRNYGGESSMDLIYNFFENKLSPTAQIVKTLLKQEDFSGKKPSIGSAAVNLGVPLIITTGVEAFNDPNSAGVLAVLLAEFLGIGANTYGLQRDWSINPNKHQQQFLTVMGKTAFTKANNEYNQRLEKWFNNTTKTAEWKKLSEEKKAIELRRARVSIQNDIYDKYNFEYEEESQED